MPTPLIDSTSNPSIRAAIDISLDSVALPDSIIALDLYIGAGMRDVLLIDPLAESRAGSELQHAQTAAVLFTAARLIGALPQMLRVAFADHSAQVREIDPSKRAAELRAQAAAELESYLDPGDTASNRPTMFGTARGYRGRW